MISALSQQLALLSAAGDHPSSDNPFTHLYAAIAGRIDGANAPYEVQVYYHVVSPKTSSSEGCKYRREPKVIRVRQDSSVEEVIGYALWCYWDEGCEPGLDEGLLVGKKTDEEERKVRMSASGWCLRIVEDEGDVDDDFPGELMCSSLEGC